MCSVGRDKPTAKVTIKLNSFQDVFQQFEFLECIKLYLIVLFRKGKHHKCKNMLHIYPFER